MVAPMPTLGVSRCSTQDTRSPAECGHLFHCSSCFRQRARAWRPYWLASALSRFRPALFCIAGLGNAGCERRAAGPEECLRFAEVWLGRPAGEAPSGAEEDPFREQVLKCLTVPYDRELVRCALAGETKQTCMAGFLQRSEARHHAVPE
jgi:hypothetical protein